MNGIVNLLKPPGMTSHDAVAVMRNLTGIKRIGHTGTLDPGASGVLPICIGQATRVSEYVLEMQKSYRAELSLGSLTDTEDAAGTVLERKPIPQLEYGELQKILQRFLGPQLQIPPMYSAIRIKGEKLYERARRGETIERTARPIHIYSINLLRVQENTLMFDVTCSRGTYIRTLCIDIALKLGTVGHMSFLLRTSVGPFLLEQALTFEECKQQQNAGELLNNLQPIDVALSHLPALETTTEQLNLIKNGVNIKCTEDIDEGTRLRVYGPKREFVAIGEVYAGYLHPRKVFN